MLLLLSVTRQTHMQAREVSQKRKILQLNLKDILTAFHIYNPVGFVVTYECHFKILSYPCNFKWENTHRFFLYT